MSMDNGSTAKMAANMRLERDLRVWWLDRAEQEIDATVPKAVEYGAGDLEAIGRDMRMTGTSSEGTTPDDELGVYFYIVGKMARWRSAIERGERVSDDTLLDIGVYVRMAQRIRSNGGWPGAPTEGAVVPDGVAHQASLPLVGLVGTPAHVNEEGKVVFD